MKEVEEFWLKNFNMTTKLKDYIPDCDEIRNEFSDVMEDQYEHGLHNKSFGGEDRFNNSVTLEDRILSWLTIFEKLGGRIPKNIFDYSFDKLL